jgi:hypothetical protein
MGEVVEEDPAKLAKRTMLRISLGARPVAGLRLTKRPFLIKGPARDVTTYLGLRMNSGVEARRLEIQPLITITK